MDKPEEIFSDNHILILDKPAGMPTQSDDPQIMNLQTWGQQYLKQKLNKPGNVFLHPIHRLDKPVRGLVIFAKTSKALSRLNEQIKEGKVKKTYHALVEGTLKEPSGTLTHYLRHDEHRAVICSKEDPLGKKAILEYRLIKPVPHGSLVEITLLTGRYHQIRAQFSAISHPSSAIASITVKLPTAMMRLLSSTTALNLSIPSPVSSSNFFLKNKFSYKTVELFLDFFLLRRIPSRKRRAMIRPMSAARIATALISTKACT